MGFRGKSQTIRRNLLRADFADVKNYSLVAQRSHNELTKSSHGVMLDFAVADGEQRCATDVNMTQLSVA